MIKGEGGGEGGKGHGQKCFPPSVRGPLVFPYFVGKKADFSCNGRKQLEEGKHRADLFVDCNKCKIRVIQKLVYSMHFPFPGT